MAIDFMGHCALPQAEAQRRIDYLRRQRPDWFGGVLHLTDAQGLGPFGHEIALTFGVDAKCIFSLHLLNKDWLDECRDAVEYVYQVFGTDDLVITWGADSVRPPLARYRAIEISV
jgi:hypothetical protein